MYVYCYIDDTGPYIADELVQLSIRGHFKDLLAEVVPKLIYHEVGEEGGHTLD